MLSTSTLLARKLANNPRSLVAAPQYLQKFGTPKNVKDLAKHNCIFQGETRQWGFKTKKGKVESISVTGNFDCNHGDAIRDALVGGLGIGLRSDWSILNELNEGHLVRVLPDYSIDPVWNIWAVRPPGPVMPARVRVFLQFLKKEFEQLPQ